MKYQQSHEGSAFVRHEPCPSCGSRNNLARYTDGHAFCFGCEHYETATDSKKGKGTKSVGEDDADERNPFQDEGDDTKETVLKVQGEIKALVKRGLNEETCKHWSYRTGTFKGKPAQYAHYFDPITRKLVGTKVRLPKKEFIWLPGSIPPPLYGAWLWREGGKRIIITEGEIDALTVSQLQQHKWPVVSLTNGAASAKRSIQKAYEYLDTFETIVLMLDNDEPGRKAAEQIAPMFAPGKVKIATLPYKDANECLQNSAGDAVIQAQWNAKTYRPDGIVSGDELYAKLTEEPTNAAAHYPWQGLNDVLGGLRTHEIITLCSGSGMGKTTLVRAIAHHLIKTGERVGMLMLEESAVKTARSIISYEMGVKLHKISQDDIDVDRFEQAYKDTVGSGNVFFYDHFGSTSIDNILDKVRYMAKALGCRWVVLDHISIIISGLGEGDERRLIDNLMTKLRTLVEECGIGLLLISHLKRPDGKGHEEGAATSLSQLRGSHAIAQLSDGVLGIERNQQDPENGNKMAIRILKDRHDGQTGVACELYYNDVTGRITDYEDVTTRTRKEYEDDHAEF